MVMTRPFKALVYYEKDIRMKVQELEEAIEGASVGTTLQLRSEGPIQEAEGDNFAKSSDIPRTQSKEVKSAKNNTAGSQEPSIGDDSKPRAEDSLVLLQHLKCLVEFMDTEIQAKRDYLTSDGCQEVAFTDLWYLFSPGDVIIQKNGQRAYRIIGVTSPDHKAISPLQQLFFRERRRPRRRSPSDSDSSSGSTSDSEDDAVESRPVSLYCVYLDFDGKRVGPVQRVFEIARFEGYRAVTSLEAYPLRFSRNDHRTGEISLRERLIHRGKSFIDVATVKHMHYSW